MTPRQSTRSIDWGIADRLKNDRGFRQRFIKAWAQADIATQVRALRKKRRLNQTLLAKLVGTRQSAISRAEQADYDGWTFKTLVNLADGLDARLRVSFEPIEEVISLHEEGERASTVDDIRVSRASAGAASVTQSRLLPEHTTDSSMPPVDLFEGAAFVRPYEAHNGFASWGF